MPRAPGRRRARPSAPRLPCGCACGSPIRRSSSGPVRSVGAASAVGSEDSGREVAHHLPRPCQGNRVDLRGPQCCGHRVTADPSRDRLRGAYSPTAAGCGSTRARTICNHGLVPDSGLVAHIRARGCRLPLVDCRPRRGLGRRTASWRTDLTAASELRSSEVSMPTDGSAVSGNEERHGVSLTNLDQPLFEGAGATKRDLVDYLDAVRATASFRSFGIGRCRWSGSCVARRRSCRRTCPSTPRPGYVPCRCGRSPRSARCPTRCATTAVRCCGSPTSVRSSTTRRWLVPIARDHPTHLVLDLDPSGGRCVPSAVRAAQLVRQALAEVGLTGAVKTSGAKGVHVFVPLEAQATTAEVAAATRAIAARAERLDPALATTAFIREDRGGKVFLDSTRAGGATVVAAYSPRLRPGVPVSFPVAWDELDRVLPADFTVHTAARAACRRKSVGGADARAAAAELRPDRRGPHHPGCPGAGDARGQASGSRATWLGRLRAGG